MVSRTTSLMARAIQWLAQREHSPAELRQKLLRVASRRVLVEGDASASAANVIADSGDNPREAEVAASAAAEVDALLEWLSAHGHLSAQRFVDSRVNARQARHGTQRIQRELQQHGLAMAPAALLELRNTELSRARQVWQRKYGRAPADLPDKLRQMRFLAGRGFSHAVVRQLLQTGVDDDTSASSTD